MGSFAVERFGTERLQISDARRNRRAFSDLPRTDPSGITRTCSKRHAEVHKIRSAAPFLGSQKSACWRGSPPPSPSSPSCSTSSTGEVLLYGDAIAHINIARRVFDSRTPGLLQLGTVWLPLPHLLMIPFIVSMKMWRTGAGGSIPSMAAYVFGVIGIFRLTRGALAGNLDAGLTTRTSRPGPPRSSMPRIPT